MQESDEKAKLNQNPGGEEAMAKVGGEKMGLPFIAFLDANGQLIINSRRQADGKDAGNIGHPYQPEEVDWFITMVKKAAPSVTAADVRILDEWLRGQKQLAAAKLSQELAEIAKADQDDRKGDARLSEDAVKALKERDAKRRERVVMMVRASQVVTADDYYHAALVMQHGEVPEDFLLAHELAMVAAFKGRADAKWLSAASLDRLLQSIGRPQHFGTQYQLKGDSWTQDPFERMAIPNSMRKEFGVPTLNEQRTK